MAAVSQSDSKRMYSWWWDSHISPKNSKWLQENLTDMDSKVKLMIKLIEEDADSFARRAEMYYKKRPELMKLVEEFYRAYRALAERYDHATVVIRQAHRTMAEAFPNQVPPVPPDDAPPSAVTEPRTPAFLDSHELQKYASGTSPSHDVSVSGEDVDHEKFAQGRARKGLNFIDPEENNNGRHYDSGTQQIMFDSDRVTKTEMEILALKKALAKLEGDKEAGLLHYQQSMERLSNLESEVSHTQESSRGLDERASKAEAEVLTLKEELIKLQAQREVSLIQYQQCLERIFNLEDKISSVLKDAGEYNERATKAETEASSLKQDLARVEAEKEAALVQHKQCLETLENLEGRLLHAEEKARKINEQAKNTENELEAMKLKIARLTEEKEDAAVHYQKCLDVISSLEHKLSCAEEEMRSLKCYVDDKTEKLQSSEQKCFFLETSNQTLQSELQSLMQKMGSQSEEINEKQKELGKLWTCVQEERLRFMKAETDFQTLQHLHTQSQEELRSLTAELHNKAEILKNVESCKLTLQDEVRRVMDENQALNEHKWSSSSSIKNLQDEILNLRKTIAKLEQEVELRLEERNSLQQGIYCLKEELNDVSRRHKAIMEEVSSTGLDPQCLVSSVRKLQDENSKLKETREADRSEKAALLEKLEIMDKLMEKNAYLENSLSDLNIELQNVRGKVKLLEETCHSLLTEKSTLVFEKDALFSQLQTTIEKLEKLSEKNKLLENSLFDVNAELEGLRVKTKILEDSCHLLDQENFSLISGRETLVSQFNSSHQTLKNLEKRCSELEMEQLELKGEKEFALHKVEELLVSLYTEKEEHYRIVKLNKSHLAEKELQIQILQEDANCQKKEYEDELDKALQAQIEIFILQNCIQELEKKNSSLLVERQRILEAFKISEELISQFKNQHVQKQVDMNSLYEITRKLSIELLQAVKTLDLSNEHFGGEVIEEDLVLLNHIHDKLKEAHNSFATQHFNESQQLAIENLVLVESLGQLRLTVEKLVTERGAQDKELRNQSEQFLALKAEVHKILEKNQEHMLTISKGEERMEAMAAEIENLHKQLSDADEAYNNLQEESCKTLEEKKSLMRRISDLDDEKSNLEEEIHVMICETIAQSGISVIFKNIAIEKIQALKEIGEGLDQLRLVQNDLRKQIEQWETLAATLYAELQISTVYETLFEGKVWELADTCEDLENGWNSRVMESERMKERIGELEHENGRLRGQLAAYVPVFNGLGKCIASLELQIHVLAKSHDNEEPKVNNMVIQQYGKGDPHTRAGAVDAIPDLQDMQKRIHAIEMSVKQMNASFKGKDKVKEIQALKSVSGRYQENIQWNKHITIMEAAKDGVIDEHKIWKSMPDIPVAENEVLPKDIMLDQMSECSSYGLSRRETLEVDDQMLELWETTNKDSNSIGLTVGQTQKTATRSSNYHQRRTRKESKLKFTSTESLIEKELSVDKLEISSSRRIRVPREEGNKRKVLEKLDSDAQKLTNLHIVVQDLMKKVDITRQRPMGKDIEYDTVKRQLEAAEESITKLFEANRKVVKNVEDGDRKREIAESDESSGSVSRRRAYEQARRGSEKIGRLQLEVQRLQFLLLKLDDEIESRAKTKIADRNPRVLLRDYLYGGTRSRTIHKKKKAPFCGCVQPPTKA